MIALISCGGLQPVERRPLHARGGTANEVDRAAETKTHTKNLFQKNILKGVLVFLSCLSFRLVLEIGRPIARSSQKKTTALGGPGLPNFFAFYFRDF